MLVFVRDGCENAWGYLRILNILNCLLLENAWGYLRIFGCFQLSFTEHSLRKINIL